MTMRSARNRLFAMLILALWGGWGNPVLAACIDLQQDESFTFEGTLTYRIFPGPPNFEDVRRGDTPEPSYILKLDDTICATGDEFVDPNQSIDRVQIYPADPGANAQALLQRVRSLVGQRVSVEGKGAFGAFTGHHHAPLLLPIVNITSASDPYLGYGTAMTTVQAFYLALGEGNGDEAAKFVIPEKRASGPLSALAITTFYGALVEPLTLIEVTPIHSDEYRARYTFVARGSGRCDGVSIVRTTKVAGANLIASIKALNGC